jgi:hypothetical protein
MFLFGLYETIIKTMGNIVYAIIAGIRGNFKHSASKLHFT